MSRLTTRDPEAASGKSPLPPPGPFVTPTLGQQLSGIQPKFAALSKSSVCEVSIRDDEAKKEREQKERDKREIEKDEDINDKKGEKGVVYFLFKIMEGKYAVIPMLCLRCEGSSRVPSKKFFTSITRVIVRRITSCLMQLYSLVK